MGEGGREGGRWRHEEHGVSQTYSMELGLGST